MTQSISHMSAPTPYHTSSSTPSSSPSRRSRRSSRSPSSRPSRTSGPGILVVPAPGAPAAPTATVPGDFSRRRYRSPSRSLSRFHRPRRSRRSTRSLSFNSDLSGDGNEISDEHVIDIGFLSL